MLREVLYLMGGFPYSSVRHQETESLRVRASNVIVIHLFIPIQNMTMSTFYSNEDIRLSASMNANVDDDDDDFDEMADQPLNRPKADFVPVRDPLVAALFGPAIQARGEIAAEAECGMVL